MRGLRFSRIHITEDLGLIVINSETVFMNLDSIQNTYNKAFSRTFIILVSDKFGLTCVYFRANLYAHRVNA